MNLTWKQTTATTFWVGRSITKEGAIQKEAMTGCRKWFKKPIPNQAKRLGATKFYHHKVCRAIAILGTGDKKSNIAIATF